MLFFLSLIKDFCFHDFQSESLMRPQGMGGSGENGYLFSRSWGALVIIFRDLESKLINMGIKFALIKSFKKSQLKRKAFISFDFFLILQIMGEAP